MQHSFEIILQKIRNAITLPTTTTTTTTLLPFHRYKTTTVSTPTHSNARFLFITIV
jgi:hypothetical protein